MNKQELLDELNKIKRQRKIESPFSSGVKTGLEVAIKLVKQLDEPEVLSQEWIEEHKEHWTRLKIDGYYILEEDLQNLTIPKQELPVVPQFVADWIEKYIEYGYDLYPALKKMENNSRSWGRIYEWYRMNNHKFVNAYLTGEYKVEEEEEQKYNVQLKVKSGSGTVGIFLYKQGDKILAGDNFAAYYPEEDKFRLTEQEIKDCDERYWPFAVEVAE